MYTCVCACMCVCVCVSVCVLRIVSVDKILHFIKYFIIYMYSWPWTLQRHHWATPFFVLKALHLFCLCYVCRKREVTVTSVMRKEVFIVKWALCVCVCVCVRVCVHVRVCVWFYLHDCLELCCWCAGVSSTATAVRPAAASSCGVHHLLLRKFRRQRSKCEQTNSFFWEKMQPNNHVFSRLTFIQTCW